MRTTRLARFALSMALASLLALSCNNSYGVFSSVQQEKKQKGTSVFQETPVYSAFKFNGSYYAATATLNARSIASSSGWSKVNIVSSTYYLAGAVVAGGKIYALIQTGTEPNMVTSVYYSTDGGSWTALPGTALPAQAYSTSYISTFDALFATSDGELYAENHSYDPNKSDPNNPGASTYTLYHFNGTSFDLLSFASSSASSLAFRGVVKDATNYWFNFNNEIFRGSLPDASNATDVTASFASPALSGKTIWGLSLANGKAYITTYDGYIFQGSDFTGYQQSSLPLTQVAQVPPIASGILLVGTDYAISGSLAVGYYEGAYQSMVGGASGAVDNNSAIYNTTVYNSPVHAFFYDPVADASGNNTLFICVSPSLLSTAFYGLYSSVWNGSSWSGWSAE